jgi:predicted enzyme related to lactoylglutathione lyase
MEMREMNEVDDSMYIFPAGEGMVSGTLFQADGFNPSKDGVRLYFDGDPDLSAFLGRVESAWGKVLKPKTVITKEIGYCADFMDTEGNIVSLHSRR